MRTPKRPCPSQMNRRQLLTLLGELAEIAGAANAVTEAVLALARTGKPIDARMLDRLIDELAALHVRAADLFGVAWPSLLFRDGPLYAELKRRMK